MAKVLGVVAIGFCFLATGCNRHEEDAIVVDKEYIAAAEPKPDASAKPDQREHSPTVIERPLAPDETVVGVTVMKAKDRGTSSDPRAMSHEQWLVEVRLMQSGRVLNVPADRTEFDKVKPGNQVRVRYQTGKYTGTVWGAELDLR